MGRTRIYKTAVSVVAAALISISSPAVGEIERFEDGWPILDFEFPVTADLQPDYDDRMTNCQGVKSVKQVIGGCENSEVICVCNVDCYWMQVCLDN